MPRHVLTIPVLCLASCLAESVPPGAELRELDEVHFLRDVRPIFADACFVCHGSTRAEANLRLDKREDVLGDRRGYPIVVPGSPDESLLLHRLNSRLEPMPPILSARGVSSRQLRILRKWIEVGAPWIDHWAFTTPERPSVPAVSDPAWAENPIDAFVRARLDAERIAPSPPADPAVLARRLALDLTGLPPSIEDAEAFIADPDDAGWIDRMASSDRAAEHLAREWLDAARYADTNGYHMDLPRTMWAWRDWVIDAYRNNLPYDRFLTEQIAGDLLPDATSSQRLATGFNRNHSITIEGGVIDEEYKAIYVSDRIDTLGTAVLGMSVGCARCHDHRFDPILQKEYYRLAACFAQTEERGLGPENGFAPTMEVLSPLAERELAAIDERIAELNTELAGPWDISAWETEAAQLPPIEWFSVRPFAVDADNDTVLLVEEDDGIAAHDQEVRDAYHLELPLPEATRAIAIEAIEGHGPERSFLLTEVEGIDFAAAEAEGFGAPLAIDRDPTTGWMGDRLVLSIDPPLSGNVRLRLHFGAGETRVLKRFRIRSSSHPLAALGYQPDLPRDRLVELWLRHISGEKERARALAMLKAQRESKAKAPLTMVMRDRPETEKTYLLIRGRYDMPGDEVSCGVISTIHPQPRGAPFDRTMVAEWLTDPTHPLTARVAVNRIWQRFFGIGLARTSEELGTRGEPPSHPELLDWLAQELIESGWDLQRIARSIATSRTYRQSSVVREDAAAIDPENRLLWRGPRHRLAAEVLRDQALFASGLLVEKLGGPSALPYQPPGLWEEVNDRAGLHVPYLEDAGDGRWRRSVYSFWKRTLPPPLMSTFDAPNRGYSVVRRQVSNTPLQAIAMLGEPGMVEAARHLAAMMLDRGITYGFRRALVRSPAEAELAELDAAFAEQRAIFRADPAAAARLLAIGASPRRSQHPPADHAAMTQVARIIFNLGETQWKE